MQGTEHRYSHTYHRKPRDEESNVIRRMRIALRDPEFHLDRPMNEDIVNRFECTLPALFAPETVRKMIRDIKAIVVMCLDRLLENYSVDKPTFAVYVNILCRIINCLVLHNKCALTVQQFLPLISSTVSIPCEELLSATAHYIRLTIRYHPKLASEISLRPLLEGLLKHYSPEIMKLLFCIHSYNPSAFRARGVGQLLLSLFSQPSTPVAVQRDCLTLLIWMVDGLLPTSTAIRTSFGLSLSECVERLLVGGSEETGCLLSQLLLMLAQRDLFGTVSAHANAALPKRLPLSWPNCLETILNLLVGLANDCHLKKHKHLGQSNCIKGCLDAIAVYLKEARKIKHVIICLVAFRDLKKLLGLQTLQSYQSYMELVSLRIGVDQEMQQANIWLPATDKYGELNNFSLQFEIRDWINSYEHQNEIIRRLSQRKSSSDGSNSRISSEYSSSLSSSSSTGSSPSTGCAGRISDQMNPNRTRSMTPTLDSTRLATDKCIIQNSSKNSLYTEQREIPATLKLTEIIPAKKNTLEASSNIAGSNEGVADSASLNCSTTTAASYDFVENSLSANRLLHTHPPHLSTPSSSNNPNNVPPDLAHCVESASRIRLNCQNQTNFHNLTLSEDKMAAKSAPQLVLSRQVDAIQRFHEQYYDKLTQYMNRVLVHVPFPAAVSLVDPSPTKLNVKIPLELLWLDNRQLDHANDFDRIYRIHSTFTNAFPSLTLYFSCSVQQEQCLYPGNERNTCFQFQTTNAITWMQLIILGTQIRYGRSLPSTHPTMDALRHLWSGICGRSSTYSLHTGGGNSSNSVRRVRSDSARHMCIQTTAAPVERVSRPASLCEPPTTKSKSFQWMNRVRTWNSMRVRSRRKLNKVSSFFLLATRAFPNGKECESLVKELRDARFFDIFELDQVKRQNPNRWCCFLCKQQSRRSSRGNILTKTNYVWEEDRLEPISRHLHVLSFNRPSQRSPELFGFLKVRYIRHLPRALAWVNRWQIQVVVLRAGFLKWRKCSKDHAKDVEAYHRKSDLRPVSGWRGTTNDVSNYSGITSQRESPESQSDTDRPWSFITVSDITNIESLRHRRTGLTIKLEIKTTNSGTVMLKSITNKTRRSTASQPVRAVSYVIDFAQCFPKPDVSDVDELALWSRLLQVAIVRDKSNTDI
ncbi:hypothetical protein EG68_05219 [Paragonimus skrjabini miyazakii]|uniref:Uncharacterized protein n=1 Tax=Paragonimus skrjabini miyazakii TaxID=59628 RepID=A0A8S9YWY3_9TREM|nr:hypothetical protein EG68_05219 [Paragonimus skrjabini miyazakii]